MDSNIYMYPNLLENLIFKNSIKSGKMFRNLKLTLAFLVFIFFISLNAQIKPDKYYNDQFIEISKEDYDKQKGAVKKVFDLKDQKAYFFYFPKTRGKLSSEDFNLLKSTLNEMGGYEEGTAIIIYYPGVDPCNKNTRLTTWNIFEKKIRKTMKEAADDNVYWVFHNDEDIKYYHPKKVKWQPDKDKVLQKLFFKVHYPCFSSAVIDKEGNYILNLGEFGKHEMAKDLEEISSKNK